jgi:hypothetical protein
MVTIEGYAVGHGALTHPSVLRRLPHWEEWGVILLGIFLGILLLEVF